MRWQDTSGHRVVNTSDATSIGTLDGIVIDPDGHRVTALVIDKRLVSWSDAGGIGDDAVTLESPSLLRDPQSDAERLAVDGTSDPLSKPVLTEDGFALGTVEDLEFDAEDGEVKAVITSTDRVEGSRLLGVGSYAVMVSSPERTRSPSRGSRSDKASDAPKDSAPRRNGDRDADASNAEELDGLTRAELYEMAQERDISGRSKMNKAELVRALS